MPTLDQSPEDFLDMIVGIQGRRMDDQRAALSFLPGLQHPTIGSGGQLENGAVGAHHKRVGSLPRISRGGALTSGECRGGSIKGRPSSGDVDCARRQSQPTDNHPILADDEDFIDMLMRCQVRLLPPLRSSSPIELFALLVTASITSFTVLYRLSTL